MADVRTCVLVAASQFNARDFRERYEAGLFDYVMAVDAGFAYLEDLGVRPDMALGDFDSLGYVPTCQRVSRFPREKDQSDLELALERAKTMRYDDVYVYGALGGRIDFELSNLQAAAKYSEAGLCVTLVGEDCAVRALTGPDVLDLPLMDSGTVSVIAMSDRCTGMIERGMVYSLDDEPLTNRESRGVSNELAGLPASVGIASGTVLVFYPLP